MDERNSVSLPQLTRHDAIVESEMALGSMAARRRKIHHQYSSVLGLCVRCLAKDGFEDGTECSRRVKTEVLVDLIRREVRSTKEKEKERWKRLEEELDLWDVPDEPPKYRPHQSGEGAVADGEGDPRGSHDRLAVGRAEGGMFPDSRYRP